MQTDRCLIQRARLRTLALTVVALALGAVLGIPAAASATTFNPAFVISDANMRASGTLSQSDIQAFLNAQKGPLKSLVTTDYNNVKKPAAQIINEACNQWHINPRVMLSLLQKEQSLLTRTSLDKNTLSRAIGAGCPNGSTNKYPGFGKQMWYGARLLDGYGEGKNGSTIPLWKSPYVVVADIYQHPNVDVRTSNLGTYKLYIYNPSIGAKAPYGDLSSQASSLSGNANFWMIFRKNFGDPTANPPGYHTRAVMRQNSQLWNATIRTKRSPSPTKGGFVNVTGPIVVRRGRKYVAVSWGGHAGWVRYDHIRWA
ncbi:MAG: hypothetical protein P4L93_08185 [Coriobacteriia bacterium]|nr:hypothetical protein [Coriobacteriia bacterium]